LSFFACKKGNSKKGGIKVNRIEIENYKRIWINIANSKDEIEQIVNLISRMKGRLK
jgi:hypothetical protein